MGYLYSRYRPASHRMKADEYPNHKFGYNKRKDPSASPGKHLAYQAECTCGWRDPDERWVTMHTAKAYWNKHILEVSKQGSLF